MKILVLGSSSFLAQSLLNAFVFSKCEHQFITINRKQSHLNIQTEKAKNYIYDGYDNFVYLTKKIIKKHNPDLVINCLANYGRNGENFNEIMFVNFILPMTVFNLIKNQNKTFINIDTVLSRDCNSYSFSKKLLRSSISYSNSKTRILNLLTEQFYGFGEREDKFLHFLIKSFLDSSTKSIPLTNGTQIRDFVHISDVINAIRFCISNLPNLDYKFYEGHIKSNNKLSIKAIVYKIRNLLEDNITNLEFGAIRLTSNRKVTINPKKDLLIKLKWKPLINLDDGLKDLIHFYRNKI